MYREEKKSLIFLWKDTLLNCKETNLNIKNATVGVKWKCVTSVPLDFYPKKHLKSFKQTVGLNDSEFTGRMVVQSYEPTLLGLYSFPLVGLSSV